MNETAVQIAKSIVEVEAGLHYTFDWAAQESAESAAQSLWDAAYDLGIHAEVEAHYLAMVA